MSPISKPQREILLPVLAVDVDRIRISTPRRDIEQTRTELKSYFISADDPIKLGSVRRIDFRAAINLMIF